MSCDNIVIMTDFAVTLNLRALKTMSSSVNVHSFLDNIIVISNQRTENVKTSNRNSPDLVFQEYQINEAEFNARGEALTYKGFWMELER